MPPHAESDIFLYLIIGKVYYKINSRVYIFFAFSSLLINFRRKQKTPCGIFRRELFMKL